MAKVRNIVPAKPMIGLAQAVDAVRQWFSEDVPDVRSSLLGALQTPKELTIHSHESEAEMPVAHVVVAQYGAVVAAYDCTASLAVWDTVRERRAYVAIGASVTALAGCSFEPIVLVVGAEGSLHIRDLQDGTELQAANIEQDGSAAAGLATQSQHRSAPTAMASLNSLAWRQRSSRTARTHGHRDLRKNDRT